MKMEEVRQSLDKVKDLYTFVYEQLSALSEDLKHNSPSESDLCDIGFFCREMANIFEELRKEVNARKDLIGKILAFGRMKQFLQDPTTETTIHGKYSSGTPDLKQQAELPRKGTPELQRLAEHFGIPEDARNLFTPSWTAFADLCTQLAADGKKLPPGLGKTIPLYTTTFRRKGSTHE